MIKKKRNFIIKIFSLLLLGIISVTLLGSWTYDPVDDVVRSENYFDIQNLSVVRSNHISSYNVSNNSLYLTTNGNYAYVTIPINTLTIDTVYTIKYDSSSQQNNISLLDSNYNTLNESYNTRITFTNNDVNYLQIYVTLNDNTSDTFVLSNFMVNEGATPIDWEPYGQTYVNQQRLDDLELDYDELAEQYSNLYDEKEQLQQNYNNLQSQYTQLQQQYNTLQSDFTTLQNNYTSLQSQFTTLQNNYNALQTEYNNLQLVVQEKNATIDSLENQLEDLQEDYDVLHQTWIDEVAQLNVIISQLKQNAFDINDYTLSVGHWTQVGNVPVNIYVADNNLIISDYLSSNGLLNTDSIFTDYIEGQSQSLIILLECQHTLSVVNDNISFTPLILSNVFKVIIPLYYNGNLLGNFEFYPISNLNPNSKLDLYTIISNDTRYSNYNLSGLTYRDIYLEYPDSLSSLLGYVNLRNNDSYNQGYYQGTIDTSNKFSELSNDLSTLQGQYNNLEQRYDTLLAEYNTLVNTPVQLNFRNLIWYIAETPFTSFKTIWNVDFLGLNIASFITGILSIWLVIFIIRKIFK